MTADNDIASAEPGQKLVSGRRLTLYLCCATLGRREAAMAAVTNSRHKTSPAPAAVPTQLWTAARIQPLRVLIVSSCRCQSRSLRHFVTRSLVSNEALG